MVATFSPHRDAGGTFHIPSHSGIHHVDPSSAIRQLRRSLSRSPSKSSGFSLLASRGQSPSKHTPYISSPLSPSRRSAHSNFVLLPTSSQQSSFAVPHPPSAKIVRPAARRTRTSPRSPAKRALKVSADQGNTMPRQPVSSQGGEENMPSTPVMNHQSDGPSENAFLQNTPVCTEPMLPPNPPLNRAEKRRSANSEPYNKSPSPIKRSEGIMGLDQLSRGSPSAKRRSIQATIATDEFNIFDDDSAPEITDEPMDESTMESDSPFSSAPPQSFTPPSIPTRSSSLRRSTVQKRQNDRSLFARSRGPGGASGSPSPGSPIFARPRVSPTDGSIFQQNRESLFSPRPSGNGSLFQTNANSTLRAPHAAHPLSRTITQSSSGSSLVEESPTHEPAHRSERPRPMLNFSRSLPVGAARPTLPRQFKREDSTSSGDSLATPENYKLAKPLPAAFMSTGLISKKNRPAEDSNGAMGSSKNMPDTPCKRPVNLFPTGPNVSSPDQPPERPRLLNEHFASPASPSDMSSMNRQKPGLFARGMSIFDNTFNKPELPRRGSIASVDDDEHMLSNQSPCAIHDSQSLTDVDFPPTPTKRAFFPSRTFPLVSSQFNSFNQFEDGKTDSSPLNNRFREASPHTPQDHTYPLYSNGQSIFKASGQQSEFSSLNFPATPTGPRESFQQSGKGQSLHLNGFHVPNIDTSLTSRFEKVEFVGTGEFSQVYRVSKPRNVSESSMFSSPNVSEPSQQMFPDRIWAVKKSKDPYLGLRDRERRIREVDILRTLAGSEHIISLFDSWEESNHLYIQTEFCEEGSLDVFLAEVGLKARLDDFRIWKILLELSSGVKHIHDLGFIHLDLKPANVLITFEGVLKIADFGMATRWPAEKGIDGEGDREYIGPEILRGQFDKPADIFALGLIIFETAGNVELPDNGVSWQKLRNGDISDVPSLTWSLETSVTRDASGNPISEEPSFEELCASDLGDGEDFDYEHSLGSDNSCEHKSLQMPRSGELQEPPSFMVDANHEQALEGIVRWMISPEPADRPTADQVQQTLGVRFAENRRRAGATIFEGNWGPADEVLAEDAEMIDV